MEPTNIQPVVNEPALLITNKKILVVADLHIGIESELRELGLHAPSQTSSMTTRLTAHIKKYCPDNIILLGDIKHNIPSSTIQERTDVKRFLTKIHSLGTIHVLPGNHDGNIKRFLAPDIFLHPSDGFVFEGIGFVHGHRWPSEEIMNCEHIVIGHTHPTIMLTDRLGYKTYEPCWLKSKCIIGKLKEKYPNSNNPNIIVMPAFNPFCGGIAVNKEPIIGPFSKIINIKDAETYLLDGSLLGKVKDIK
ncbi:MAG: metallophosphoesterase [Thermoplasmatales archaeon]|nr:MAG: metallophosphoesterase [Thermoplasmatales archaeon]